MEESSEADHPFLLLSQPVPDASSWIRHPELYVLDGNIVLLCENTLFRISGGMLALNSEVFKDMMSLASNQPIGAETYDGCPYIRLTDRAKDLEVFLKALFIAGSGHLSLSSFYYGSYALIFLGTFLLMAHSHNST